MVVEGLKPLSLVLEQRGTKLDFLNITLSIEKGFLETSWFKKDCSSTNFLDYRSLYSDKMISNVRKNQMRLIRRFNSNIEGGKRDLDKFKISDSFYPDTLIDKWLNEVINEDGLGNNNLWKIKWRVVFQEVFKRWNKTVIFAERKYVQADEWCMLRALAELDKDCDLLDLLENIISYTYQ